MRNGLPSATRVASVLGLVLAAIVVTALIGLLGGCGGGGSTGDSLTQAQMDTFGRASTLISAKLQSAGDQAWDVAIQSTRAYAVSLPEVTSATVADGDLTVQYAGGGREMWLKDRPLPSRPADLADLEARTRAITSRGRAGRSSVGTNKAVLINALADDPGWASVLPTFDDMKSILEATGFEVTTLAGPECTPDALRRLSGDSVIVMLGHGGLCKPSQSHANDATYCVQTGAEWAWYSSYSRDWLKERIVAVNVDWGAGDAREDTRKRFVAVTSRFWSDSYADSHFSNGLFMNLACSGASSGATEYRDVLLNAGVAAYTGWTEGQGVSPWTAWRTLAEMADGQTLGAATALLPESYRTYTGPDGVVADLWIGPDAGKDITLGQSVSTHPQVLIKAPVEGETIVDRECTVVGMITPWAADHRATVSVNGQSSALPVDASGEFAQPVGLRAGTNTIRVSAIGASEHSATVNVTGSFTSDVLYTSMWWNRNSNDVDLHLVPVEGAEGRTDECYFGNKQPGWGAVLDVDDVDGFGPEHITASSLPAGKYRLFVHYYATHEQTLATTVNVAVSANGQPSRIFAVPQAMTAAGDNWDVCYITYPSGQVEPIGAFTPAGRASGVRKYPAKR